MLPASSRRCSTRPGVGSLGIRLREPPVLDLPKTVEWKETIVDKLNNGVGALLKRVKVKVVPGWATFLGRKDLRREWRW